MRTWFGPCSFAAVLPAVAFLLQRSLLAAALFATAQVAHEELAHIEPFNKFLWSVCSASIWHVLAISNSDRARFIRYSMAACVLLFVILYSAAVR